MDHFPDSYQASRDRFLSYGSRLKARGIHFQIQSFQVPSRVDANLYCDLLYIPSKEKSPSKLIVLASGNHGPESYTGSALQNLFFEENLENSLSTSSVLMIHAMNPYGFKYHRRNTENNVNLNRNFDTDVSLFLTQNPGYQQFRSLAEPHNPSSRFALQLLKLSSAYLGYMIRGYSFKEINDALAMGQYDFPQGIEFGGRQFEPQVIFLSRALREIFSNYRQVHVLDIHTGLGPRGFLSLICGSLVTRSATTLMKKIYGKLEEKKELALVSENTEGFYPVRGDFLDFCQKLAPSNSTVVSLTMEFGTLGTGILKRMDSVARVISENQGHHQGYQSESARQSIQKCYLEKFNPSCSRWRQQVLQTSKVVFKTLLESKNF